MGDALVGGRSREWSGSEGRIGAGECELAEEMGVDMAVDVNGAPGWCRLEFSDETGGCCRWDDDKYGLTGMCDGKLLFGNM